MEKSLVLSFYNTFVDNINPQGDHILFNSRTGKQLKITNDLRECLEEGKFHEIPNQLLEKLTGMKALIQEGEDELGSILEQNKDALKSSTSLYQVIMPSGSCQLGCYYCGQAHRKVELTDKMNVKILERVEEKISKGNYNNLSIGWFGGEPLMALQQLRFLSGKFQEITSRKKMTYQSSMTTNGLSLKPNIYRELVTDHRVKSIEVTLDGTKEYHDKHRYLKSGGGSFDIIVNNLKGIFALEDFDDLDCKITIRCNLDNKNYESFVPLLNKLKEEEFQGKIKYVYPVGIYSWGNDAHLNSPEKQEQAKAELLWYSEMYKRGFWLNLMPGRKKDVCLSVNEDSDVYDANGDVWNCTETPYVKIYSESDYKIGNLLEGKYIKKNVITEWNDELKKDQYWCNKCPVLPMCGGRCPKSWVEGIPACPTFKFNLKDRLLGTYYLNKKRNFTDDERVSFEQHHKNNPFIQSLISVE